MTFLENVTTLISDILQPLINNIGDGDGDVQKFIAFSSLEQSLHELCGADESKSAEALNAVIGAINSLGAFEGANALLVMARFAYVLSDEAWEQDVPNNFFVHKLNADLLDFSEDFYIFNHPDDINKSIIYYRFRLADFEGQLRGSPHVLALLALLLADRQDLVDGSQWILSSNNSADLALAACKYQMVLSGKVLHEVIPNSGIANNDDISYSINYSVDYLQYNDIFNMLGEINSRNSLLDKFLSCYHALENYMIRAKIRTTLARNSQLTSVRSFKALGVAMDKGEAKHFSDLFETGLGLTFGGAVFKQFLVQTWGNVKTHVDFDKDEFNDFFQRVGLKNNNYVALFDNANDASRFNVVANLIYQVRCCIVHNKDTEYHISNKELKDGACKLVVEQFCLPIMLRFAYGLPSVVQDNPIKYRYKSISLY